MIIITKIDQYNIITTDTGKRLALHEKTVAALRRGVVTSRARRALRAALGEEILIRDEAKRPAPVVTEGG